MFLHVLAATGIWNLLVVSSFSSAYGATIGVKLGFVAASGLFTAIHQRASTPALRGATAGLGLLAALAATLLGVSLPG